MSGRSTDVWVGAGVILVVAALVGWASGGGKRATADGYTLSATFEQVDGITVGSPVQLAGVQIGRVAALRLNPKSLKPVLTLAIRHKIGLPVDSAAMILSDGVLGGKFIRIEPGAEDEMMAPGGAFEFSQSAVIIEHVLERVVNIAEERLRPTAATPPKDPGKDPAKDREKK